MLVRGQFCLISFDAFVLFVFACFCLSMFVRFVCVCKASIAVDCGVLCITFFSFVFLVGLSVFGCCCLLFFEFVYTSCCGVVLFVVWYHLLLLMLLPVLFVAAFLYSSVFSI